ncbi:hypothetical protein [Silvanigrella aquatica]|uniref:hypothetical protein n=1 Tax=Silvanigrella aquatica TaxID=1915309 RepID=UPI0011E58ECB|nr:hypothetical protein [Silvanigrella aquatica]
MSSCLPNQKNSYIYQGYQKHLQILLEINQKNKCKNLIKRLLKMNSLNKEKITKQLTNSN